jgi:hypothetical protein
MAKRKRVVKPVTRKLRLVRPRRSRIPRFRFELDSVLSGKLTYGRFEFRILGESPGEARAAKDGFSGAELFLLNGLVETLNEYFVD